MSLKDMSLTLVCDTSHRGFVYSTRLWALDTLTCAFHDNNAQQDDQHLHEAARRKSRARASHHLCTQTVEHHRKNTYSLPSKKPLQNTIEYTSAECHRINICRMPSKEYLWTAIEETSAECHRINACKKPKTAHHDAQGQMIAAVVFVFVIPARDLLSSAASSKPQLQSETQLSP